MSWSKWDGAEPIDADMFLRRAVEEDAYLAHQAGRSALLSAAAAIRVEHGPEHPRREMWEAIAHLLEVTRKATQDDERTEAAIAVARAYLNWSRP